MAKKDTEQEHADTAPESSGGQTSSTSPAERAVEFIRLAIEALGESRSVKYADEYAHIAGRLEWAASELEQRL